MQEWNRQRTLAIERALNQFLYPQMAKELKSKLVAEAKESIVRVIYLLLLSCKSHAANFVYSFKTFLNFKKNNNFFSVFTVLLSPVV